MTVIAARRVKLRQPRLSCPCGRTPRVVRGIESTASRLDPWHEVQELAGYTVVCECGRPATTKASAEDAKRAWREGLDGDPHGTYTRDYKAGYLAGFVSGQRTPRVRPAATSAKTRPHKTRKTRTRR